MHALISFVFKIISGTGGINFPLLNSDRGVCRYIFAVHIGASFIMQEDAYSGFSSCSWKSQTRCVSLSPSRGLLPVTKVAEKRRGQLKLCLGREGVDCFGDLAPLLSTCQRVLDQTTKLELSAEGSTSGGSTSTIIKTRSRSGTLSIVASHKYPGATQKVHVYCN